MHPKVALINENGVIERTDMDNGRWPEDGESLDGRRVQRIYDLEGLEVSDYISTRVWSDDAYAFVAVDRRPNMYADFDWSTEQWVWDTELILNEIRTERDRRLMQTDWALMVDTPLSDEQQAEMKLYRQALRDFPSTLDMTQVMSLQDVEDWPVHPSI
jgi:hypothetical protein